MTYSIYILTFLFLLSLVSANYVVKYSHVPNGCDDDSAEELTFNFDTYGETKTHVEAIMNSECPQQFVAAQISYDSTVIVTVLRDFPNCCRGQCEMVVIDINSDETTQDVLILPDFSWIDCLNN